MHRTFIGRLVREILLVTDAGASVFVDSLGAWFSPRTPNTEILGPGFIQHLHAALGVPGAVILRRQRLYKDSFTMQEWLV